MSIFKTITNKLFAVTDGVFDRAAMGNLDPYTGPNGVVSPAQYGFRAINADGNAIFDSQGLIDVATSAGFMASGSSQLFVGAGAGSFSDITGSSFNFMVKRAARIDYRIFVTGLITAGAGSGYIRGNILGFDISASIIHGTPGTQTSFIWYFTGPGANFDHLPAGAYSAKMEASADVGTTWKCAQFFHQVFVLGA